jgi:hypothetical protein
VVKKRLPVLSLFVIPLSLLAAPPTILRLDTKASMAETSQTASLALEEARFWLVFEAAFVPPWPVSPSDGGRG